MHTYEHSVSLDVTRCTGCTTCLKHCPTEAIRIQEGHAVINPDRCLDCGLCIRYCPNKAKKATYYGIGMAMVRITKAIFGDENSVLTVSAMLRGEYGENGVFVGTPCILNRNGIRKVLELPLSEDEQKKFKNSCSTLQAIYHDIRLEQ